ncbi:hypothetical protein ABW19_dt0204003 [Dactylella cylindrospora]|nr:hypothetical protein ABW19_dt0204003 [Dactylella cylindrospora]
MESTSTSTPTQSVQGKEIYAFVDYSDDKEYVQPLIKNALQKYIPNLKVIYNTDDLPQTSTPLLCWAAYETLDFTRMLARPDTNLFNAYVIRKALIRKHYLMNMAESYTKKNPESCLKQAVPTSVAFEVDYAEFLDEALVEEYELLESLTENETKPISDRQWWILKPGMSDRGVGIRLFSTMDQLQGIFDAFEEDEDEEDEEEDDDENYEDEDDIVHSGDEADNSGGEELKIKSYKSTGVITSRLRHFVAQVYIPPLLLQSRTNPNALPRKFHIRTYVLAFGAITVYVYKPMLALFAATPYSSPTDILDPRTADLSAHLTNTCLQSGTHDGSVVPFWKLSREFDVSDEKVEGLFKQVCDVTSEVFKGAISGGRIHFQPVPNAFELFGFDYLVDEEGKIKLLEVNAFPDFKQTGEELKGLVEGLFEEVVRVAVRGFFGLERGSGGTGDDDEKLVKVLETKMGGF